jgi:hypothetical protein
MNQPKADLRHLAAAMAGPHRALVSGPVNEWAEIAHKALPLLTPMKRKCLDMAYRMIGSGRETSTPPLWFLTGDETDEQVLGGRRHPGVLALASHGLLVFSGAAWDDRTIESIAESMNTGVAKGIHKTEFCTQPAFVMVGEAVSPIACRQLQIEVILRGTPAKTANPNKLADAVRRARASLDHDWYVMPADRDLDSVTARVARALAAVDGARTITPSHVSEARTIVWRTDHQQEATP